MFYRNNSTIIIIQAAPSVKTFTMQFPTFTSFSQDLCIKNSLNGQETGAKNPLPRHVGINLAWERGNLGRNRLGSCLDTNLTKA